MEYDVAELTRLVEANDVENLKIFMSEHDLEIKDNLIVPKKDNKEYFSKLAAFWDQRQLARKILLNSLYGALLNVT